MEPHDQAATGSTKPLVENRRQPRFKFQATIKVNSRTCGLLKGETVDISESGISALLKIGVPIGEMVELQFTLPFGDITIYAVVRQKIAFRYGFQFVTTEAAKKLIAVTCRRLAVEQTLLGKP